MDKHKLTINFTNKSCLNLISKEPKMLYGFENRFVCDNCELTHSATCVISKDLKNKG